MNVSVISSQALKSTCKFRICTRSTRLLSHHPGHVHRHFATTRTSYDDRFRPHYVTTPIFYVNAVPHAGHLYTIVLADSISRWQVLKGDTRASLLTGTDEHGQKVSSAASKLGITPKELCDQNAEHFRRLAGKANISYFRFMRTTDPDHKLAVEHCWKELQERGYLYQSKHEGWYCTSDECFYPESKVHLIIDPPTGRKIHVSMETGKEVEWTSEINYHFRLSAFKDRLLEHYEQHPNFIVPAQRMSQVKQEVANGLKDLSVSRPSSRLQWGIRVPGDDSQTIYVWIDALLNYASACGYPFPNAEDSGNRHTLWPPNVQVIGKDIVRFHCIYWPALLMALDIPLPRAFLTHAHWTMGNAKMSKSSGNGVDPFLAIDRYGLDTIRYFLIHDGGIVDDADYDNSLIVDKYKKGLQGGLGNLLTRIVRGRAWSIRNSVEYMSAQKDYQPSDSANVLISKLASTAQAADDAMEKQINPRLALHTIMQLVYEGNKYFADTAPWELCKDPEKSSELHEVIFATSETIRIACILLQPFIPDKARQALDQLNVAQDRRSLHHAAYGADSSYGPDTSELEIRRINDKGRRHKERHDNLLFPPLMTEF